LAYSTDSTGFRQYVLQVKDLRTGTTFPERFERVTSAAWASDNRTLFYTVEDETTKRSHRLYRHVLGSTEPDLLLYEEPDERFESRWNARAAALFCFSPSRAIRPAKSATCAPISPAGEFRLVAPREDNHEYYADHHPGPLAAEHPGPLAAEHPGPAANAADEVFYIRTNSGGRTFRLVTAPATDPRRELWREIIPNRPDVMLAAAEVFQTHLVLFEREGGLPYLRIVDLTADAPNAFAASHRIEFAEPAYNASIGENPEFAPPTCDFNMNRS